MQAHQITSKGQITIPMRIRKLLKIKKNDKFTFEIDGENIVLSKAKPLSNLSGYLKHDMKQNQDLRVEDAIRLAWDIRSKEFKKK